MKTTRDIRPMEVLVAARWLSMAEACAYARRSMNTLKKYIADGKIYGSKLTGEWIVDRESIDRYYEEERDRRRIALYHKNWL